MEGGVNEGVRVLEWLLTRDASQESCFFTPGPTSETLFGGDTTTETTTQSRRWTSVGTTETCESSCASLHQPSPSLAAFFSR